MPAPKPKQTPEARAEALAVANELSKTPAGVIPEPGVAAEPVAAEPVAAEEPVAAPEDFDAWYTKQPAHQLEEYNKRVTANVSTAIDKQIRDTYGDDAYQLFLEAAADKELLADIQKLAPHLTKKESREFLSIHALKAFEDTFQPVDTAPTVHESELDKKVRALESKLTAKDQEEVNKQYLSRRTAEVEALAREFPDLRWSKKDESDVAWRLLSHISNVAEDRTTLNRTKGTANPEVSYKQIYDEWRTLQTKEHAPSAPATSPSGPSLKTPQAPKTRAEARQEAIAELNKYGGFTDFARAISGKK
jgi:hypothetical protein